jgi:hypothetical protein
MQPAGSDGIGRRAMDAQFPQSLSTPRDYQKLHTTASIGMEYANTVIFSSIGPPEDAPDEREAASLSLDMLRMHMAFEMYWVGMRWDMESERSLSGGGSDADRMTAPTTCFYVSSIALVAASCISGYADPESETALDTRRNGKPFSALTALDFGSVSTDMLIVSPDLISEYSPRDITRALESIMHAWDRVGIDEDIIAYVLALRIQAGMLMLSADMTKPGEDKRRWWNRGDGEKVCMSIREKKLLHSMVESVPTGGGRGATAAASGVVSMLSASCVEEMAARFIPFSEMSNINRTMKSMISPMVRPARRTEDETHPSLPSRIRLPSSSSSPSPSPSPPQSPLEIPQQPGADDRRSSDDHQYSFSERIMRRGSFDPCDASIEVMLLLIQYAKRTIAYGTLSTNFREHLQESMVSPGDYGTMRARDKGADLSSKNAIKLLRGSHFLRRSYERTLANVIELLESALRKVKDVKLRSGGKWRPSGYFTRSLLTSDEEYAVLCTFESMFSGRYGIEWKSAFLVTRSMYGVAMRDSRIGRRSELPALLLSGNTYDLSYGKVAMRTSCIAESLAWWLEIMRTDHNSALTVIAKNGSVRYGGARSLRRLTETIRVDAQEGGGAAAGANVQRRRPKDDILIFGDDGSNPGCGLNTAALPKSSIIVLSIKDMCCVPTEGFAMFPACGSKRKCIIDSVGAPRSALTIITL